MTTRRFPFALLLLLGIPAAILLVPTLIGLLTDYWWFQEIQFGVVFSKRLFTQLALFAGVGLLTLVALWGSLAFAQRGVVPGPVMVRLGEVAQPVDLSGALRRFTKPVAIGLALLLALGAAPAWESMLLALNGGAFGVSDPVFGRDVGWYVFTLPALAFVLGTLRSIVTLSLFVLVPVYFLRGDVVLAPRGLRIEPSASRHLGILLAAWFLLGALSLWFVDASGLLFGANSAFTGAGYTDLNVRLPALRVGAATAVLGAILAIVGALRAQLGWFAFLGLGIHLLVAVAGRGVLPGLIQKFVVKPTELTREAPYIARHLEFTRRAWGLDSVEHRELPGDTDLTLADIRANGPTIDNVRLWDRAPLLRTFKQLQEIRTYYDFVSVDDDRYWIDGEYRQVLLSPRELNPTSLPTRTFINEHLTFTHGMGVTLSPVNEVTSEGLPVLFVQDLPPRASTNLAVTRPQLYFGELTNTHVFVKTRQKEFDYPSGEANVFAEYEGRAGVPVGGLARRAVFAAAFGNSTILLSGDMTAESRVLYHRNIVERATKAFPYLLLDRDPYLVIAKDGSLHWIQDAFTATARYPYAFRAGDGVSYMRNSVKIVIDAYHGSVRAFIADPNDPIAAAWSRVFPGTLQPLSALEPDLREHIRYPDDLFRRQTALYATYHLDTPEEFYSREDQWQIPVVERADGSTPFMRHIIMRLPDEPTAEFIYMTPFTPRGKDNLAAWMIARNDGEHYGRLRVYQFPRQSLVYGPRQVENRINQNPEISRQLALWDQRGSEVIRGDLLVIPIEQALLYVQPIYLQAEGGRIPELRRVVVAYDQQVVMRESLDEALAAIFGSDPSAAPAAPRLPDAPPEEATAAVSADLQALITEARRRYDAAVEAQREGDW
ncbi:MAG TPA: UPF0182 family protein, partial [Gemmatimonadaceae bacterium]|nr:UPF0182 family protein [Gemmatimonadaceae bacterium]